MTWAIRGNSTGPCGSAIKRVHRVEPGKAEAICGAGRQLPPWRTTEPHQVTCRRCQVVDSATRQA